MRTLIPVAAGLAIFGASGRAPAQSAPTPRGLEIAGVPALNFNSDEGFGYGAVLQIYDYGAGLAPYRVTLQPTLLFTTRGKRDLSLFLDAPHVLPEGWRLGAYIEQQRQLATPWYGVGNDAPFNEQLTAGANPYFYRFGSNGFRGSADIQHTLGVPTLRMLFGVGGRSMSVNPVPYDSGTTLLAQQLGTAIPTGESRYARVGLIWDTRDREVGTHRGTWSELLVQRSGAVLGANEVFTRSTLTTREYVPLTDRVTLAERLILQNVTGSVPFYELFPIQSSFKDDDGLGGAGNVRGIPKDRYAGKGLALANSELRWRAAEFTLRGKPSAVVLSGFVDAGRVWASGLRASGLGTLHVGVGGGARLALGPSFVVATDVGHSSQSAAAVYIGLGYLF
jgi:outer membrane protein assembly factor BamA